MMSSELFAQYERQERWRHWAEALTRIPLKAGQRILDLGCRVGQIAARFPRLGAPSSISDEITEFYASARATGRHDFQCGRRLAGVAERAGLTFIHEGTLPDDESAFRGQHQPTYSKHGRFDYSAWLGSRSSLERVSLSSKGASSKLWQRRIIDRRRASSSLLLSVHHAKAQPCPSTLGQSRLFLLTGSGAPAWVDFHRYDLTGPHSGCRVPPLPARKTSAARRRAHEHRQWKDRRGPDHPAR